MYRALPPVLLLALAAGAHAQRADAAEAPSSDERVAELYANRCASCHVPPDPRFAVDRAWIAQLADTA